MVGMLPTAAAFLETLWRTRRGQTRAEFERWQRHTLDHWLTQSLPKVDFYCDAPPDLAALPIIDKATVMGNFAAFNQARISAEQGWAAFATTGEIEGISIGASTGTSGNRALYAVTEAERYRWLGTILAKTLPRLWAQTERVVIILPQNSALYDSAKQTKRLQLEFYDLRLGIEAWQGRLEAFAPTSIVAPPRVLRHLAENSKLLQPRRLYAGGETLDPVDRAIIEARFKLRLGQIYMATEGLLAVSCPLGHLHLAEDANFFEFEAVGDDLVTPIITSFRRDFQILARYRMNDLLRLSKQPCGCGSSLRGVDEVIGRLDDAFVIHREDGSSAMVTPDVMRNAVLDAARDITDFRIIQEMSATISLWLHPSVSTPSAEAARVALVRLFNERGFAPEVHLQRDALAFDPKRKLRRVECRLLKMGGA